MTGNERQSMIDAIFSAYAEADYGEALERVKAFAVRFPDDPESTVFWQACLESRLGVVDDAIETLRAGINVGLWWPPEVLLNDPDVEPLRDHPAFHELKETCAERLAAAQAIAQPELTVLRPDSSENGALLIALHPRGRTQRRFPAQWEAARASGALVAFPRSSQVFSMTTRLWDDRARGKHEVRTAFERLVEEERFDPSRVVLAGSSQGAAVALEMALAADLPRCAGVIAVAPAKLEDVDLESSLAAAAHHGLRIALVSGELEPRFDEIAEFHAQLTSHGIVSRLDIVTGVGHDFPPDFAARLPELLAFVTAQSDHALADQ